jgi:2-hydroxychromene-2-carboxylate isomerase
MAEFAEGQPIDQPPMLARILESLGADPAAVLNQAGSDAVKTHLRAATDAAAAIGIFGAPSFVCSDGELFWGNDRLEAALVHAERLTAAHGKKSSDSPKDFLIPGVISRDPKECACWIPCV